MNKEMVCDICKRWLNVAFHNAFMLYNIRNSTPLLIYRFHLIKIPHCHACAISLEFPLDLTIILFSRKIFGLVFH
jgi:hypothetical protein